MARRTRNKMSLSFLLDDKSYTGLRPSSAEANFVTTNQSTSEIAPPMMVPVNADTTNESYSDLAVVEDKKTSEERTKDYFRYGHTAHTCDHIVKSGQFASVNQGTPRFDRETRPGCHDTLPEKNATLTPDWEFPSSSMANSDGPVDLYTPDVEEREPERSPNGTDKLSWRISVLYSSPSGSEWSIMDVSPGSDCSSQFSIEEWGNLEFPLRPVTEEDWRR